MRNLKRHIWGSFELVTLSGKRISVFQNHEQVPGLYTMGISGRALPKGASGNYRQSNRLLLME
jgi:hypothetical protein